MSPEEYGTAARCWRSRMASRERHLKMQAESHRPPIMRRGEAVILATIGVVVAGVMVRNAISLHSRAPAGPRAFPFYSTAIRRLARAAGDLYRSNNCRQCHSLWTVKSAFESVPAPALDGIGSLRSEEWFYQLFLRRRIRKASCPAA